MALLRAGLLVVLSVAAVAAKEGCEAEDEALLQVTKVDTIAGSQFTPKTSAVPSFGRDGNFIALLHDGDERSHTRPRAFAHQEWQPLSLASQHIERTASSSHFTVSGSNLRLAIFMTTVLSGGHRRFFNCWENAIQKFKFLRDADLVLHAPTKLLPDDLAKFQHMRNITVRVSDTAGKKQAGAIKSFKEGFGSKGFHQGWFKHYDWVIRLNPDVLFMDASWILHTMQNASIDGIFQRCLPGCRINTDFFAVRPKAVDFARVENSTWRNAEGNAAVAFGNILAAGRYTWLPVTQQSWACRVRGRKSPVVHNHSLSFFCPDYLGQRSQQKIDNPRAFHWPMDRCHGWV